MDQNSTAPSEGENLGLDSLFGEPIFSDGTAAFASSCMMATAQIMTAYIARSQPMSLDEIVTATGRVGNTLFSMMEGPGDPAGPPAEELKPAVPIKKSIQPDHIVCLEDGKKFKSLKRHLRTHYDLSPDEYREKWGLPADYPMVAPNYSATRSQLAKDNGLGRKVDA